MIVTILAVSFPSIVIAIFLVIIFAFANRRKDFVHKASRNVINTYQVIALEKLEIQDMQSNGNKIVNRDIGDVAWRQFTQACLYKAEDAGRTVVLVDPRNTTKECSGCGTIVPKTLRDGVAAACRHRVHKCDACGLTLDRDINASVNILRRGLASLDSVIGPRGHPSLRRAIEAQVL